MIETTSNLLSQEKEISIFSTSICSEKDIASVKSILDLTIGSNSWNFDLEDCDNILRIHANVLANGFLVQELQKLGFKCQELF